MCIQDNNLDKRIKWTENEKEILRQNYFLESKEYICNILTNHTWGAIGAVARKMKLKRTKSRINMRVFLVECPITFYWLGYLMADGHFSNGGISCDSKDIEHLRNLADYIGSSLHIYNHKTNLLQKPDALYANISVKDINIIQYIKSKYDISSNKTYKPSTLFDIENDKWFLCSIIGFIDGDGNIATIQNGRHCNMTLRIHSAWQNTLEKIAERLTRITEYSIPVPKLMDNRDITRMTISNNEILRYLKVFAKSNDLPIMERKWNKISDIPSRKRKKSVRYQRMTDENSPRSPVGVAIRDKDLQG